MWTAAGPRFLRGLIQRQNHLDSLRMQRLRFQVSAARIPSPLSWSLFHKDLAAIVEKKLEMFDR